MATKPHPIDVAKSVRRFGATRGICNIVRASVPGRTPTHMHVGQGDKVRLRHRTSDWETFSEIFLDQCYRDDFVELFGLRRPSETVRTVVDAGANVGYASVYFRQRYPNASVWAIEPNPDNFDELLRNTEEDAYVHPIFGALWNAHEFVAVEAEKTEANGVRVHANEGVADALVQGYTMHDVLSMVPDNHIDVLKIDVEGAERFIFDTHADRWLEHVSLILIELHDWKEPGCTRAYHEAVSSFDYAEFSLGGTVGTVIHGRRSNWG